MSKKLELTDRQFKALNFMERNPYHICAMNMGLGKTAVALSLTLKVSKKSLIIVPAYLLLNWIAEINKWDWGRKLKVSPVTKKKDIPKIDLNSTEIIIISYDNSVGADSLFSWADHIICDEAQNLKSMKAKRTESIHRMVYENSVERLTLLTGTPIKNRVEEFYSLIALCYYNPELSNSEFLTKYPDSITFATKFSYRSEFLMDITTKNGRSMQLPVLKFRGVKEIPELKAWLKPIYYRDKGAPDTYAIKEVVFGEEDSPELLELFESMELNPDKVRTPEKLLAANTAVEDTINYVKSIQYETDSPVVVFSDHREPANRIAEALGVTACTGEIPSSVRMAKALSFNKEDSKEDYIVATVKALGEGVTLTRSYNLVFNDLPWSAGDLLQVIKRIDRMGQKNKPIIHIIHKCKQSRLIYEKLLEKLKTIERAT